MPLPGTRGSTPCSRAMLRTSGEENVRALFQSHRCARRGDGRGRRRGSSGLLSRRAGVTGAEERAAWAPPSPITATTACTGTVSPSLCRISVRTPAAGLGISASTLSVEISNSGWSRSTLSPTFTSHFVIVPSAIDSPICGITTSVAISLSVGTLVGSMRARPFVRRAELPYPISGRPRDSEASETFGIPRHHAAPQGGGPSRLLLLALASIVRTAAGAEV
jgi:hypothetical protein